MIGAAVVGGAGMLHGVTIVEKLLTELATPVGFVWLMLIFLTWFCFLMHQRMLAGIAISAWLVLTLAGNALVSQWLIGTLEGPYQNVDPFQIEKLDGLIVLGGGTNSTFSGRPQAGMSGDRVVLAARLFHAGKVDQIICTGSATYRESEHDLHPREEAQKVLTDLGVPKSQLVLIEGDNTSQELANIRGYFESTGRSKGKYGLLTSASHLSRAMRLAQANGLEFVPVPADFRAQPTPLNANWLIPGAQYLDHSRSACKEYLARLLGR